MQQKRGQELNRGNKDINPNNANDNNNDDDNIKIGDMWQEEVNFCYI